MGIVLRLVGIVMALCLVTSRQMKTVLKEPIKQEHKNIKVPLKFNQLVQNFATRKPRIFTRKFCVLHYRFLIFFNLYMGGRDHIFSC